MAREDYPDAETAPGGTPSAFILHHTAGRGSPASVVDFWKKQGKGYGAQYIMDRDGVIHDTAKEFGYTGTNEILNDPRHKLSNANVVGMEIVANDDKDVTPAQAQAAAAFIQARYPNLPVYGHGQVNPGHKEATEGMTAVNAVNALRGQTPGTTLNSVGMTLANPIAGALAEQGPENAGSSGATAASEGPLDIRQLVYNKLTAAGLQSHQALGAVWSLAGESGKNLDPTSYNPNDPGSAVGIGQWTGGSGRRQALEAFAKARGTAVTDPNTQADFLVDEITNPKAATYQPGVFAAMQQARTAADATKTWTKQFERPKVDNSDARIKNGTAVASLDDKGNFVLGSGGGGATSAPAVATNAPSSATTTPDKSWLERLTQPPTDAQGNPVQGAKSPLQELTQASIEKLGKEGQSERDEAPARSALEGQGPGLRNASVGMGNISQVYGNTLNSFLQPLTWTSKPLGAPGMPAAGLQPSPAPQVPGMSLTSVPASPGGLGYGVDPNLGYGFG